jgi:hypothetical protein
MGAHALSHRRIKPKGFRHHCAARTSSGDVTVSGGMGARWGREREARARVPRCGPAWPHGGREEEVLASQTITKGNYISISFLSWYPMCCYFVAVKVVYLSYIVYCVSISCFHIKHIVFTSSTTSILLIKQNPTKGHLSCLSQHASYPHHPLY